MTYTLYGTPFSLFTGKARGYLRWKDVAFEEVLSTPDIFSDIILPNVGWPVVPVMKGSDGTIIQDTAEIIEHVERDHPAPTVLPTTPLQHFVSELLHTYGDQWLVIPAMHYRWHHNEEWVYGEFGSTALPGGTKEEQYAAGKERGSRFKGMIPMLGVTEATIPYIEKSYENFLAEFSAHLEQMPFVLGHRPSLADFSFIGPLYAHLYRDPASGEIMKRRAPKVADWTLRTHDGEKGDGDFVANDAIPETLLPILKRMMAEMLPTLLTTDTLLDDWVKDRKENETEIPVALGAAPFTIEGRQGVIAARSFSLYRLQAALDVLDTMPEEARKKANDLLDQTGGQALKTFRLSHRMKRENYKLHLA